MTAEEAGIVYRDVSMKDCVKLFLSTETNDGRTTHDCVIESIPEELMSALDQYSGDGRGRVSVGGELATNTNFGFKASASVFISVTCHNDLEVCESVHDLVRPVVQRLVEASHAKMANIRADLADQLSDKPAARLPESGKPESKSVAGPPKGKPLPRAKKPGFKR